MGRDLIASFSFNSIVGKQNFQLVRSGMAVSLKIQENKFDATTGLTSTSWNDIPATKLSFYGNVDFLAAFGAAMLELTSLIKNREEENNGR